MDTFGFRIDLFGFFWIGIDRLIPSGRTVLAVVRLGINPLGAVAQTRHLEQLGILSPSLDLDSIHLEPLYKSATLNSLDSFRRRRSNDLLLR